MFRRIQLLLLLSAYLVACSEDEQPQALVVDFEITLNGEEAPVTVTIHNLTEGAVNYSWEFPGGEPSSADVADPTEVIFNNPGTHSITLTASNEQESETLTKTFEVLPQLSAAFEMSLNTKIVPSELEVVNNSIGAESFEWTFVGGTPNRSSEKQPGTIVYDKVGDYDVVLKVTGQDRSKSSTQIISLTDHVEIDSDWFSVDYLSPGTYIFKETKSSQYNISYLILGDSRAMMFDTGSGENSAMGGYKIKNFVDQITELPVTLLLSHFHFDHNQNISEFDYVGFPALDFLQSKVGANNIYTFSEEELFLGTTPAQVKVDEWLPLKEEIDLGNRTIELINIPGHTDESVAIIDKTNKLVFMGDYLYSSDLFVFDLDKYETSVDYLIANIPDDYRLFGAHGSPEVAYSQLATLKAAITKIKASECSYQSTTVYGKPVQVYNCEGLSIVLFI